MHNVMIENPNPNYCKHEYFPYDNNFNHCIKCGLKSYIRTSDLYFSNPKNVETLYFENKLNADKYTAFKETYDSLQQDLNDFIKDDISPLDLEKFHFEMCIKFYNVMIEKNKK